MGIRMEKDKNPVFSVLEIVFLVVLVGAGIFFRYKFYYKTAEVNELLKEAGLFLDGILKRRRKGASGKGQVRIADSGLAVCTDSGCSRVMRRTGRFAGRPRQRHKRKAGS